MIDYDHLLFGPDNEVRHHVDALNMTSTHMFDRIIEHPQETRLQTLETTALIDMTQELLQCLSQT